MSIKTISFRCDEEMQAIVARLKEHHAVSDDSEAIRVTLKKADRAISKLQRNIDKEAIKHED